MPSRSLRLFALPPTQAQALGSEETAIPTAGEPCGPSPSAVMAVELLDEFWYSCNVLSGRAVGIPVRPPTGGNGGVLSSLGTTEEEEPAAAARSSAGEAPAAESPSVRRSLLRTPSLPPRVERGKPTQEGPYPHSSSGGAKLRHSHSNLESVLLSPPGGCRRQLSPQVISQHHRCHTCTAAQCGAARRPRLPRDSMVESIIRYVDGHHRAIAGEGRRKDFQVKKWRSLGDLETEEVQGFKDLGFVFDEAAVNPGVLEVVPGLRDRRPGEEEEEEETKKVRRPYLSEAWLVQRSAPPVLDWVGGGSAADVKELLRFWARVVASNVRQEC